LLFITRWLPGKELQLRRKIAVNFSVSGDARFLSHQDMMHLFTRAARRAGLELAYSAGYNPRPRLALVSPRPVGISCEGDLLIVSLAEDCSARQLCSRLAPHLPDGVSLIDSFELGSGRSPLAQAATYCLELSGPELDSLAEKISRLLQADSLQVERPVRKDHRSRRLDIRPYLQRMQSSDDQLSFTLVYSDTGSARPAEVLALLGLDNLYNRSKLVRSSLKYSHLSPNATLKQV
jgi:radical SAM-linked protein